MALKSRILRALSQQENESGGLTEREIHILELVRERQQMTISEIARCFPGVVPSTISSDITRLWDEKDLLEKEIDRTNQRTKLVRITKRGKDALDAVADNAACVHFAIIESLELNAKDERWAASIMENALKNLDLKISELCAKDNRWSPEKKVE